jgi:hypothetical protein
MAGGVLEKGSCMNVGGLRHRGVATKWQTIRQSRNESQMFEKSEAFVVVKIQRTT